MNLENIKNKVNRHFSVSGVEVKIKNPLPKSINFRKVVNKAFSRIPNHLLSNLKSIKVGQFDNLKEKGFQGLYQNNTIYLSNEHVDEASIIDDLIHEIAHSVEVKFRYPILGMYTSNLFYSPYAATSLREYFANGFEAFFMGEDIQRLKKVSPILYNKITGLLSIKTME